MSQVRPLESEPRDILIRMADKRTYTDRKQYLNQAVKKRRRRLKEMAVEYKGGKCQLCGYDRCLDVLEFHHLDPDQKDFGIGSEGSSRAWTKIKAELDKCVMLCANCHRETHAGLTQYSVSKNE